MLQMYHTPTQNVAILYNPSKNTFQQKNINRRACVRKNNHFPHAEPVDRETTPVVY